MGSGIDYEISKSDDYITMENLRQQIEQLKQEIDLLKKENERLRSQADFWFIAANEGKPTTYTPEERNL